MTQPDKPPTSLQKSSDSGDPPQPIEPPLPAVEATPPVLRVAGGSPIVFNANHNGNVTIQIIQSTQTTNYVHIVQQMTEFQALPAEQQAKVLETVGELKEAVENKEPSFVKRCLKHLWDESKDVAAGVIAKLLMGG